MAPVSPRRRSPPPHLTTLNQRGLYQAVQCRASLRLSRGVTGASGGRGDGLGRQSAGIARGGIDPLPDRALAAYLPDKSARCHGYGIMVFTITREGIATITGFPSPGLFGRFGLPAACD